jgi:hypothetical protein
VFSEISGMTILVPINGKKKEEFSREYTAEIFIFCSVLSFLEFLVGKNNSCTINRIPRTYRVI